MNSQKVVTLLIWCPLIFAFYLPKLIAYHHRKKFKSDILPVLDLVALHMANGLAFRASARLALNKVSSELNRVKFQKIIDNLHLNSESDNDLAQEPMVCDLLLQFKKIEAETHHASLRLTQLRQKYKIEQQFLTRKNRALSPVKAQVCVLSIIYFLAFIYILSSGRAMGHSSLVLISLLLFVLGIGLSIKFTKSFKWRV